MREHNLTVKNIELTKSVKILINQQKKAIKVANRLVQLLNLQA